MKNIKKIFNKISNLQESNVFNRKLKRDEWNYPQNKKITETLTHPYSNEIGKKNWKKWVLAH